MKLPEPLLQVLGISMKAESVQIAHVYRRMIAEARGNEVETNRIEKAHTSTLMTGLKIRLSGFPSHSLEFASDGFPLVQSMGRRVHTTAPLVCTAPSIQNFRRTNLVL